MAHIKKSYRPVYHAKPESREKEPHPDYPFYNSSLWRNTRKVFLFSNPACIVCGKIGEVVDHVIPIRQGGARLDFRNMQTMCHPCHNYKRGTTDMRDPKNFEFNHEGDKIPKKN